MRVAGVGSGTDIPTIADRLTYTSFPATTIALQQALGLSGLKGLQQLEGELHINMHDPFNGFGPINLVDLGVIPREKLFEGLLDPALTGPNGSFPTNLTGGLKGRGHPLGATGMVQIVENHQLLCEGKYAAGLSHSIGGPINNNVVVLLETEDHYQRRNPTPYKTAEKSQLGQLKPSQINLEALLGKEHKCSGRLLAKTSRFDFRTGNPQRTLLIFSASYNGDSYRFLIGVDPQAASELEGLAAGGKIKLQQIDGELRVNDIPIRRFYRKTIEGVVELADTAFRHLRRKK